MGKYLELFKGSFDESINEKTKLENKPYVAYSIKDKGVVYTIVPKKDEEGMYTIYRVVKKDISGLTYNAVDLSLPSGRLWADRNIGATSPEEYGSYFQWGDTEAFTYDGVGEISKSELSECCWSYFMMSLGVENKEQVISMVREMGLELNDDNIIDIFFLLMLEYELNGLTDLTTFGFGLSLDKVFNYETYFDTTDGGNTFNKYNNDGGLTQLESVDDAAYVHMSSEWRMPTRVEFQELIDNTTLTWIDLQGNEFTQDEAQNGTIIEGNLKGIRLTGSNSNSIFIPAAGTCGMNALGGLEVDGYYWCSGSSRLSSDLSGCLNFDHDGSLRVLDTVRFCGLGVRGVKA